MGNSSFNALRDKHKDLTTKLKNNEKPNFIVFYIPLKFEYARQIKMQHESYYTASEEELNDTSYNTLYLSELNLQITHEQVQRNEKPHDDFKIISTHDDNNDYITIYKHFEIIDEIIPQKIIDINDKITEYENEIKRIENLIVLEKNKILNSNYVKSNLNTNLKNKREYINYLRTIEKKFH